MELDIHNIKTRMEGCLKRIEKLPEPNRSLILKFRDECKSRGLIDSAVINYLGRLYKIATFIDKDFKSMTKDDVKRLMAYIEGRKYYEYTKVKFKISLKKFFQWLYGFEWKSKKYPEQVEWIQTGARKSKLGRPVILSKDEIRKMFECAEGIREKALVSFMYESGCRCPDELLHMKVSDVEFDDYGAKVKLSSGKVGSRVIRIVSCVPHLKTWINTEHPNPKPKSYLWVNEGTRNHAKVMGYASLKLLVRKWSKKVGLSKKITGYTFRRSRYTHLATVMPTPTLYKYMGQVQGSKVIERYVELNEDDVDNAVLSFYGIKNNNGESDIKPLFCARCGKQNPPEKEYCDICNAPLTEKAVMEIEKKKEDDIRKLLDFMIKNKMEKELNTMIEVMIQQKMEELKKK